MVQSDTQTCEGQRKLAGLPAEMQCKVTGHRIVPGMDVNDDALDVTKRIIQEMEYAKD